MAKLRLLSNTVVRAFETKEVNGMPRVTGTVRPPMPREVSAFIQSLTEAKGTDVVSVRAKFFAEHIKTWDVEDEAGRVAPIRPETVELLDYPIWQQLEDVVLGYQGAVVVGKSEPSSAS